MLFAHDLLSSKQTYLHTMFYNLFRYIPNISKALFTVLQKMEAKRLQTSTTNNNNSTSSSSKANSISSSSNGTNDTQNVLAQLRLQTLTEATLSEHLHKAVDKYEADSLVQSTLERSHTDSGSGKRRKLFLMPSTRVFEYPLPVLSVLPVTSIGNGDGTIDLTATPEKNIDTQDIDGLLTQDSQPAGANSSRKRNLSQLSRANTADTVNTYISTSSRTNGQHKWIPLTLLSANTSSSNKNSVTEGTQLSQGEPTPAMGTASSGAISAYILVWF